MDGEELMREAQKFSCSLLNFFWRQGVSYGEGEDLVQETFLRLWNYRQSCRARRGGGVGGRCRSVPRR